MPEFILGSDAVIYEGPTDTALGSLTEITNVKDVTLNMEADEADITTRANSGWEATVAALRKATVDFEMIWKTGDTVFDAIRTAFLTGDTVELAILDGPRADSEYTSQGLIATFSITGFNRTESLRDAITASVNAKLTVFKSWKDS